MEFKTEGNKLYSQGKPQRAVDAYSKGIALLEECEEKGTVKSLTTVRIERPYTEERDPLLTYVRT